VSIANVMYYDYVLDVCH